MFNTYPKFLIAKRKKKEKEKEIKLIILIRIIIQGLFRSV